MPLLPESLTFSAAVGRNEREVLCGLADFNTEVTEPRRVEGLIVAEYAENLTARRVGRELIHANKEGRGKNPSP